MALNEIIKKGMDNPDCAFFVGSYLGNISAYQKILLLALIYFMFKVANNLVVDPIIFWIKHNILRRFYSKEYNKTMDKPSSKND